MDRNSAMLLVALVLIIGMIGWVLTWDVSPTSVGRTTTGVSTGASSGSSGIAPPGPVTPTAPPVQVPQSK